MAVLYARIAGAWVPVGGGSGGSGTSVSEVEVQAADPIAANPNAELWYDTDATLPATVSYGHLNLASTGTVGTGKVLTWNTGGPTRTNMGATTDGLVVQIAGRYECTVYVSLASCSGGAYMVPSIYLWRAGAQAGNYSVVHGVTGFWNCPNMTCQHVCQVGDEIRASLSTDITGCTFDSRSYLEARLIGP